MLKIRLTINNEGMTRRMGERMRDLTPLMKQVGQLGLKRMRTNIRDSWNKENVHSGLLIKSLTAGAPENVFEMDRATVKVGSALHYARQRNFGGTLTPKTGKALAIPLVKKLIRDKQWPRMLDPNRSILTLIPGQGGKSAVLVDKENKLGYGKRPLFVLKTSVTQKGLNFARWLAEDLTFIRDVLVPRFLRGK